MRPWRDRKIEQLPRSHSCSVVELVVNIAKAIPVPVVRPAARLASDNLRGFIRQKYVFKSEGIDFGLELNQNSHIKFLKSF